MSLERLFHDDVCQIASEANGFRLNLTEVDINAGLKEVRIEDAQRGEFCVQTDSVLSRIALFNPTFAGVHCRCDYAVFVREGNTMRIWLFDLKSSRQNARSALDGLENVEELLTLMIKQARRFDSDIPVRCKFTRAILLPKPARVRKSKPHDDQLRSKHPEPKYDEDKVCRIAVDTVSSKAVLSMRMLCP